MGLTNADKLSTTQLLVPMCVMAATMLLIVAFQMSQLMRERDMLNQTVGGLQITLAESERVNRQFGGLVQGTHRLALQGNPLAQEFVGRLRAIGVLVDDPQDGPTPAPVPAAQEAPSSSPVKP